MTTRWCTARASAGALLPLIILCLGLLPAAAQAESPVAAPGNSPVVPQALPSARAEQQESQDQVQTESLNQLLDRVERSWWRWKGIVKSGQQPENAPATADFIALIEAEQIGRLEPFADAAVAEGRRQLALGNLATARAAFELAQRLDPQHAAATWELGWAKRRAGDSIGTAAAASASALAIPWRGYWTRYALLMHVVGWLLVGLLVTGAAAIVMFLLRHAPCLVHDIDERLPARWNPAWRSLAGWAVVLAPVAVIALGAWALLLWAVLLIPACRPAERRIIYLWLLVLAVAVPAINSLWVATSVAVSPTARVAVASAERSLRPDLLAELGTLAAAQPEVATWKVLQARLVGGHQPDQAAHLLREAARLEPADARIRLLLGNLLYKIGKHEAAGVLYREALDLDADNVVALFNLARVKMETNDWQGAEDLRHQASQLDGALVKRLEASAGGAGVADPEIAATEVASQVLEEQAAPGLRRALRPANALTLAALAALLGAAIVRLRAGVVASHRCTRCGRACCARCPGESAHGSGTVCAACDGLFTRREGLSPEARREQAGRVDRFVRRTARGRAVLNLLWPGLAQLHEGRTVLGFGLAALVAITATAALWPENLLPSGPLLGLSTPGRIGWIILGVLWLLAQCPPLRPQAAVRRPLR